MIFPEFAQSAIALAAGIPQLAYRPFLDPLPLHDVWLFLLVPMVFAVALVYKTIKIDDLSKLWRQTAFLAAQIVVFMALAAMALWLMNVLV